MRLLKSAGLGYVVHALAVYSGYWSNNGVESTIKPGCSGVFGLLFEVLKVCVSTVIRTVVFLETIILSDQCAFGHVKKAEDWQ